MDGSSDLDEFNSATITVAPTYENQLDLNPRWALIEGSRHFEEKSAVFKALRKIAQRLNEIGVPYAVVGGMALFRHGFRRFTEDVGLLVSKKDLKLIHEKLEGLGYIPPHRLSKHLRDTELKVRIKFLTSGEYPGDGKVKPVAFPEPATVSFESGGINYIKLPNLIELKLASGMTNVQRGKDLVDVSELIRLLNLPAEYSEQSHPFVREKFLELWKQGRRRFVTLWRNKWLTAKAISIEEMITSLREAANKLEEMQKDGVSLENNRGTGDDYAHLVTMDPEIAKKHDMVEESDLWDDGQEREDGGEVV